jgi:hypothetical protein
MTYIEHKSYKGIYPNMYEGRPLESKWDRGQWLDTGSKEAYIIFW